MVVKFGFVDTPRIHEYFYCNVFDLYDEHSGLKLVVYLQTKTYIEYRCEKLQRTY